MTIKLNICLLIMVFMVFNGTIVQAKDWEISKGKYFIVYYRSEVPEDFVNTVIESAEEDYRSVIENIGITWYQGWKWEKPVLIYIYRDQNDYISNGGQAEWSHGAALVATKTIRTFPSDEGFFDALLPHELGHIVLHEYLGPYADIPLWFDEGVAMYQEKAKRIGANKLVREALLNGQFIPLSQLLDMRLYTDSDRKMVDLFYAESASIVNFMISELGRNYFYRFCQELKQHTRLVDAISKIYFNIKDLDDLNKKWVNFLKDHI